MALPRSPEVTMARYSSPTTQATSNDGCDQCSRRRGQMHADRDNGIVMFAFKFFVVFCFTFLRVLRTARLLHCLFFFRGGNNLRHVRDYVVGLQDLFSCGRYFLVEHLWLYMPYLHASFQDRSCDLAFSGY